MHVDSSAAATFEVPDADARAGVEPESPSCWFETVQSNGSRAISIRAWPKAWLRGAFVLDRGAKPPSSIGGTLIDQQIATTEDATPSPIACTVDNAARWSCAIPAERKIFIRINAEPYAPVYFWDLQARRGEVSDRGKQRLEPGSRIRGFVIDAVGGPRAAARVTLTPLASPEESRAARALLQQVTITDQHGAFEFAGVRRNVYRIACAEKGYSTATIAPVELRGDRDIVLDRPLVQRARAELTVTVTPAATSSQAAWRILVTQDGPRLGERRTVAKGSTAADGTWSASDLDAGEYELRIQDDSGSDAVQRQVVLQGGRELIAIAVHRIQRKGTLTRGEAGVRAPVTFRSPSGSKVATSSDDNGDFLVDFPRTGKWRPTITVGESRVDLPEFDITDDDAPIRLELPSGGIRGRVTDGDGNGVAAFVLVRRGQAVIAQSLSDSSGTFDIGALSPGTYDVEAEAGSTFAGPERVHVESDPAEVELRLSSARLIRGTVLLPDGSPASGAAVRVVDPETHLFEETIADADGSFSVKMRGGITVAQVIAIAPPYPVAIRQMALPRERYVLLHVSLSAQSATLRIRALKFPPWPIVRTPDGITASVSTLLVPEFGAQAFPDFRDGAFEVRVEPGTYTICYGEVRCKTVDLPAMARILVDFIPATGGTG